MRNMGKIKNYNHFLILEKFDDNIIAELKRLGVTDKGDINTHLYHAHRGNLAKYLQEKGKKFTFGMLYALFLDAQKAKSKTDIKTGVIKAIHRIAPMALAPFFPIIAILGYILGTSRAFNKVIAPILADPGKDFPTFLNKLITSSMKIAEGEIIPTKDRFSRAFVVSDNLVSAIKEDVLREFSRYLSDKMSRKNPDQEVPEHYIENQLKAYLNKRFDVDPEIPLRESQNTLFENVSKDIDYDILSVKEILLELEDIGFSVNVDYIDDGVTRKQPTIFIKIENKDRIQFYDKSYPLVNKEKEFVDETILHALEYLEQRGYYVEQSYEDIIGAQKYSPFNIYKIPVKPTEFKFLNSPFEYIITLKKL
jgi:hypothetical protein